MTDATKTCKACGETKSLDQFYTTKSGGLVTKCKPCYNSYCVEKARERRRRDPERAREMNRQNKAKVDPLVKKGYQLKSTRGITRQEYEALLSLQNGRCAICGGEQNSGKTYLSVDHNHDTGRIRGLLCVTCNSGLGMFRDDPVLLASAIQYLSISD